MVIKTLQSSRGRILNRLKKVIKGRYFSYKTFGTDIEDYLIDEIIQILKEKHLVKNSSDFHRAENKNEFPDLKII